MADKKAEDMRRKTEEFRALFNMPETETVIQGVKEILF